MRQMLISLILAALMIGPCLAGEIGVEDFQVKTTKDLVDLCTAPNSHPLALQAIHFCHGYLVGAFHYYAASVSGPNGLPLVCPPDPRPSRDETIGMFIQWVKDRPQYWNELPVESEFRFLIELWPCQR
ncbi:MAG: Rap1a/Tai family immunity protein [Desulfobacterales bacterium]